MTALENDLRHYLSYAEYRELCCQRGIEDVEDQDFLVRFLHDLGKMFNFSDRMPLEDTHILKPNWVTDGVYGLMLANELKKAGGILTEPLVTRLEELVETNLLRENRLRKGETVKGRYPLSAGRFILEMMRRFELCYELPSGSKRAGMRYLVPNALPDDLPTLEAEPKNALRFELCFPRLLPTSVISRFIVHMQADPEEATIRRFGICGHLDECDYLVTLHNYENFTLDEPEQNIKILVTGISDARISVLEKIRHGLALAMRPEKGLQYSQRIPLPDDPRVTVEYELLLKLSDDGQRTHCIIGSDGALKRIDVEEMLGRIGENDLVRKILRCIEWNRNSLIIAGRRIQTLPDSSTRP